MPKVEQLLAVARYNSGFSDTVPRKGAAFAAGWPPDGGSAWYMYWSGEVMFSNLGYFGARGVSLVNGGHDWVNLVDNPYLPVAVGVHP